MSAHMQMESPVQTYKEARSRAGVNTNPPEDFDALTPNCRMAKFTIEWLSQSFYSTQESAKVDAEEEEEEVTKVDFTKEPTSEFTPASPNNSCGYTSTSEGSDAGEDSEGEAGRRVRTKFSSEQIRRLEGTFSKHRYLGASQRKRIAEKLNLSETQVKTWFQNRRMKLKREVQDMRTEFLAVPAALLPPMMLQHRAFSGQLPEVSGSMYPLQEARRPATHPAMPRHHPYHPYPALQTLPTRQMIPAFY